jgi:hypothetical protein
MKKSLLKTIFLLFLGLSSQAQHSVARLWNEVVLEGVRNDLARPTVHARNLFHISAGMYDTWVTYQGENDQTYFLGKTLHGLPCELVSFPQPSDVQAATEEALSYLTYRLILHRFQNSPGVLDTYTIADSLLIALGYDRNIVTTDYSTGSPAALGNYLAECIITYGLQDGSNEANEYANVSYLPVNEPLAVDLPGNPDITDPNRWQPLTLEVFIDQSGNVIPGATPEFLSPEWGIVYPFALSGQYLTKYERDGFPYDVYHDPGDPPYHGAETDEYYKWGFSLVSAWSSHLDPTDGVMWDISPRSIGNVTDYPDGWEEHPDFYDFENGGDPGLGWDINPVTNAPYEPQMVPRGDYARVLAEFWADGPDSETPPGHWFTILNYVNDHPQLVKKFGGTGLRLDDLEWDVKAYFILGGAMHDAAVTAWGIKGWYDYIRPISAIRYMADQGQSSDIIQPSFNAAGIPLHPGFIEVVSEEDPLAGNSNENVGKIKVKAWKGPDFILDETVDEAGVDWILAENWVPYQRPSFVTPPFAGFVSGHSTYSSAAATVLTSLTGSNYFPGGLGEFEAPANEFLVFEDGPSVDVVLQWATYQDAADQCSLSRIWGGIHPPADDIAGRKMGILIGQDAFELAQYHFSGAITGIETKQFSTFPVPAQDYLVVRSEVVGPFIMTVLDLNGKEVLKQEINQTEHQFNIQFLNPGVYILEIISPSSQQRLKFVKR